MNLPFKFKILPAILIGAGLLLAGKLGALLVDFGTPAEASTEARQHAHLGAIVPAAGKPEEGAPEADTAEKTDTPEKEKPKATSKKAADTESEDDESAKVAAKADAAPGKKTPAKHGADDKADAKGEHKTTENDQPDEAGTGAEEADDTGARLGLDDENFDPMMLSRAEIELLQGLSKRRAALEAREREFALKEQTLAAAEQKLDAKIKALETLKVTVEGLLAQQSKQEDERVGSLVKIYESMKPREAAAILGDLESDILLDVIERMKESKSASILALLDPSRAKTITEELMARRRPHKPDENKPDENS